MWRRYAPSFFFFFFAICEKPEGADNRPPAVRGLIIKEMLQSKFIFLAPTLGFLVGFRSIFRFCHQLADQNLDCKI